MLNSNLDTKTAYSMEPRIFRAVMILLILVVSACEVFLETSAMLLVLMVASIIARHMIVAQIKAAEKDAEENGIQSGVRTAYQVISEHAQSLTAQAPQKTTDLQTGDGHPQQSEDQ